MRSAPHVLLLELPAISLKDMAGTAYLDGSADDLQKLLTKQGIIIRTDTNGWQVSLR